MLWVDYNLMLMQSLLAMAYMGAGVAVITPNVIYIALHDYLPKLRMLWQQFFFLFLSFLSEVLVFQFL